MSLRFRFATASVCVPLGLAVLAAQAIAAEQGIGAKKLLLKGSKFVIVSKDASIAITGSDPVGGADSSLTFDDGNGAVTLSLPAGLWSTNGSGSLFKYKNALAPAGPSAVRIVKTKAGLIKIVGKAAPIPVPSGAATIDVRLSLDGTTNIYCMTFTGTGDGSKFLVKNAAVGSCPPPTATPTASHTATATNTPTATATDTPTQTPTATVGAVACQGGATLLSTAPSGTMVLCDDPSNTICEQDFETLCPVGWQLCSQLEFNARNDGWGFSAPSIGLGEIYCRLSSGAGHLSVSGPLGTDSPVNCWYGSSRASCTASYGCNETGSQALCCQPSPACGDGVVGPNERCDDANADESDACLNSCDWRVPAANALSGVGCN